MGVFNFINKCIRIKVGLLLKANTTEFRKIYLGIIYVNPSFE